MALNFDKRGTCKKCNHSVARLKLIKSWHHVNYMDYFNCGYVDIDRDEKEIKK